MLNGDGNENGKEIKRSNKQKKKNMQHTFLYISLPLLLQRETSK